METPVAPQIISQPRIFYADVLRFFAIGAVIILHCSSDYVTQYGDIPGTAWWPGSVYNGLSRFCIPLFVMLSGAFLLKPGKIITMKELFGKRLMKILVPLLFWSIVYVCWQTMNSEDGWDGFDLKETLRTFYQGPVYYHLWFLYMMAGLYLIYPVFNAFITVARDIDLKYFLVVWFITNSLLFIVDTVWGWSFGVDLKAFTGYAGFFVLGYYLNKTVLTTRHFRVFMACFIAGMLLAAFSPWILYQVNPGTVSDFTESDFTPDVILAASGLFVIIKYSRQNSQPKKWLYSIINSISIDAFGIYLVHVLVTEFIFDEDKPYSGLLSSNPAWGIPVKAIVILVISFVIVKLIKQVPVLKKVIG